MTRAGPAALTAVAASAMPTALAQAKLRRIMGPI
jgi:hypothetical protein